MANVLFKRGVQANLPSSTSAVDGVFYLTTDTNRLYVGQGNNLKLLNQVVQFIDSLDSLNSLAASWTTDAEKSVHVNDFYYITGGNILATYIYDTQKSQYRWEQINPDTNTVVTDLSMKATSAGANAVSVVTELTQTGEQVTTATMAVRGGTGISVVADNDALVINGETYSMTAASAASATSTFSVILRNSSTQVSAVPIVSTNGNITFAQDNGEIKVTGKDTVLQSATATLGVGTLSVTFEDSSENVKTATLNNVGILLNDNTYAPIGSTSTATSQGSIYSKAEIDTILNGLDGMTYKGTIGTSGATTSTLPTTGVKNGDTYVIVTPDLTTSSSIFTGVDFNTGTIASMAAGTKIGDMLIASGTETNGVIPSNGITWTYIPAGNDSLDAVTYSAEVTTASHTLKLKNANEIGIAKIGFTAGDGIVLSSSVSDDGNTNNSLNTTITHATYTTSALTATTADRTATFTALTAITTTNGHVVGYQEETFVPVTYTLSGAQASSVNNVATVLFNLDDSNENHTGTATFAINSSSLKISGSNSTVTVDIEWGSFDN